MTTPAVIPTYFFNVSANLSYGCGPTALQGWRAGAIPARGEYNDARSCGLFAWVTRRFAPRQNAGLQWVQRIDRPENVLELDLAVVGGGDAYAGPRDDPGGHVGESRAPVPAAFQLPTVLFPGVHTGRHQA